MWLSDRAQFSYMKHTNLVPRTRKTGKKKHPIDSRKLQKLYINKAKWQVANSV